MTDNPSADNAIDAERDAVVASDASMLEATWLYWVKKISYGVFSLSGELVAVALGLAILWFFALNVILTRQTVDISRFEPNAQMWFSEAFSGSGADIGAMQLKWRPATKNIVFEAKNIVITDKNGGEIETIPRLRTEVPLAEAAGGLALSGAGIEIAEKRAVPMSAVFKPSELPMLPPMSSMIVTALS